MRFPSHQSLCLEKSLSGSQSPGRRLTPQPGNLPQGRRVAGAPRPTLPSPLPLLVLIGVGTETFLQGQFKSLAFYLL